MQEPKWRTSNFSDGMQCVAVADLGDGRIGVRDSKNPDGAVLEFSRDEIGAWLAGAKAGEFDTFA